VLDASVALRWFLENPLSSYASGVKQFLIDGGRVIVPALWHLEMSNGLVVAERRSILTAADVDQALLDLEQIVTQGIDTYSGLISARQTLVTARTFRLSACDAVYLNVARHERLPLASLDERLRAAAEKAGIDLLS
jgi:predicted nucleic acid-binding protein